MIKLELIYEFCSYEFLLWLEQIDCNLAYKRGF